MHEICACEYLDRRLLLAGDAAIIPASPLPIGFWGGLASAVSVRGEHAYVLQGEGLLAVDISAPTQPRQVGSITLPHPGGNLGIRGDLAYITTSAGLAVVEISSAAQPVLLGEYDVDNDSTFDSCYEIALSGDRAYVTEGRESIHILDISGSAPRYLGTVAAEASSLAAADTHLYIANRYGLQIVDVSNPTHAVEVGTYLSDGVQAVAVLDNHAYIGSVDGMHILDVADPTRVTIVATWQSRPVHSIAVFDDHAYLGGFDDLRLVGISDPTKPVLVGEVRTTQLRSMSPHSLAVADGYVHFASYSVGLATVDVTDPSLPTVVGELNSSAGVDQVVVAGTVAYAKGYDTVKLLDISDPAKPALLSSLALGPGGTLWAAGDRVYLADSDGLRVLDVSDPSNPVVISSSSDALPNASRIVAGGNHVYVSCHSRHGTPIVRIIDVGDPSSPTTLLDLPTADAQTSGVPRLAELALVGDTLYVGVGDVLAAYDVSDPAAIHPVGFFNTTYSVTDLTVVANLAYVVAGDVLRIVDVSSPGAMSTIGEYQSAGRSPVAAVVGSLVYLADDAGTEVIDVSVPWAPLKVAEYRQGRTARGISVAGQYAYVAAASGGLTIFDVGRTRAAGLIVREGAIAEDKPAGSTAGTIDSVGGVGPFVYELVNGPGSDDNARFRIDANELRTTMPFDFETQPNCSIRIRGTDSRGAVVEQAIRLAVKDVNEPPTGISLGSNTVDQHAPAHACVGGLWPDDPEYLTYGSTLLTVAAWPEGGRYFCELVSGPGDDDNALFTIESMLLYSAKAIDAAAGTTFSIRVMVTDDRGLSFTQQLPIYVTGQESWPIDGTDGSDVVSLVRIGDQYRLIMNGMTSFKATDDVSSITINLLDGDDTITIGGSTPVTILGGGGNDTLRGGNGQDSIDGGDGDDYIVGFDGNDTIKGGAGNDSVYGGFGADSIHLGDGNDIARSGRDNDSVYGDAGNDIIVGDNHNDLLMGGYGNDTVNGGNGNDTLYGQAGMDRLIGSSGRDLIFGGIGRDQLIGGYDDDRLYGESGNDTLKGGMGNDLMEGGLGTDTMLGELGNDWLLSSGDATRDLVRGDAGIDYLHHDPLDRLLDTIEDAVLA